MESPNSLLYNVDIVFCIDATGSMIPHIDRVKKNALKFHNDLTNSCKSKGKIINKLRIRVVGYRDFYCDSEPLILSPFYNLPEQTAEYNQFVEKLIAKDGGDEPENGLEALYEAMNSTWQTEGRRRQVIVVYSDASCHVLEKENKPTNYPSGIPKNLDELTDRWGGQTPIVHPTYKRLILFTPEVYPWSAIAENWELTVIYPAKAGEGLAEKDYGVILMAIVNSL